MLSDLLKFKSYRRFGFPRVLPMNMTISLTSKCNSLCKTCWIGRRYRSNPKISKNDLSLKEFEKIFKNMNYRLHWLILSGGEPFLRDDIVEICKLAYRHLKPKIIVIPTNGIVDCSSKVERILQICKQSKVTINLSLDGIGKKHDEIRGIDKNFLRAMETYKNLKKLKKYKNLELGVHTVVSKFNYRDIEEIYNFVVKNLKPDSYITEIAEERFELDSKGKGITPNYEEYSKAIDFLISKIKDKKSIKQRFRLEYYKMVKEMLKKNRKVVDCYAGIASGHINFNGDVWFCCVNGGKIGNLRENNYDFRKIWFSKKAEEERKKIRKGNCFCPLASASYSNLMLDEKSVLKILKKFI